MSRQGRDGKRVFRHKGHGGKGIELIGGMSRAKGVSMAIHPSAQGLLYEAFVIANARFEEVGLFELMMTALQIINKDALCKR